MYGSAVFPGAPCLSLLRPRSGQVHYYPFGSVSTALVVALTERPVFIPPRLGGDDDYVTHPLRRLQCRCGARRTAVLTPSCPYGRTTLPRVGKLLCNSRRRPVQIRFRLPDVTADRPGLRGYPPCRARQRACGHPEGEAAWLWGIEPTESGIVDAADPNLMIDFAAPRFPALEPIPMARRNTSPTRATAQS